MSRYKPQLALAALVVVGSLWAAVSVAISAPSPLVSMTLKIQISGGQEVDWSGQVGNPPDACSDWTESSGHQEIDFGMVQPLKTKVIFRRGRPISPMIFVAPGSSPNITGRIVRSWKEKTHLRESGPPCVQCQMDGDGPAICGPPTVQPGPPPNDCGEYRRKGLLSATLFPRGSRNPGPGTGLPLGDFLYVAADLRHPFKACTAAPNIPSPMEWTVFKDVNKIARMKRGGRLKLEDDNFQFPVSCKDAVANLTCKITSDVRILITRVK